MKKLVVFLGVMGAGAIYLSATGSGKAKADGTSAPPSKAAECCKTAGDCKIGVVHLSRVSGEYYAVKKLRDELVAIVGAVQTELSSMSSDHRNVKEDCERLNEKLNNPTLTEEAKKNIREELARKLELMKQKENAMRDFGESSQRRVSEMESGETAKILATIKQTTGEVAKKRGILFVFDGNSPIVLFADGALDMTEEVLGLLNRDQPKKVATVPTAAASKETVPAVATSPKK
jgi:Skp family chaperone for outer membrane proteins